MRRLLPHRSSRRPAVRREDPGPPAAPQGGAAPLQADRPQRDFDHRGSTLGQDGGSRDREQDGG